MNEHGFEEHAGNVMERGREHTSRQEAQWLRMVAVILGLAALVAVGLLGSWH